MSDEDFGGAYSAHPKSKVPEADKNHPPDKKTVVPKAEPVLSPKELEALRQAKFRQLQIPYQEVMEAEKIIRQANPEFKQFFPDGIERDWITVVRQLQAYRLDFSFKPHDFFLCLIQLLALTEEQLRRLNSITATIAQPNPIVNMAIFRELVKKYRKDNKLADDAPVPDDIILEAAKKMLTNIDRKMIWEQAARQLRLKKGLPETAELKKEEINEVYQRLMAEKEARLKQPVAPMNFKRI